MASEVDISNLALSHLGDEANVSAIRPPDGSTQAAQCARFYPIARDALLELHPWSFAVRRADLSQLANNPLPDDWAYAYRLPGNCIRPLAALSPGNAERPMGGQTDAGSFAYIIETTDDGDAVLYTNVQTAALRYIHRVIDTSRFTPMFTSSLARLLASYLAGPIIKGKEGMNTALAQMKLFDLEWRRAAATDANRSRRNLAEVHTPSFIAARGGLVRFSDSPIEP